MWSSRRWVAMSIVVLLAFGAAATLLMITASRQVKGVDVPTAKLVDSPVP